MHLTVFRLAALAAISGLGGAAPPEQQEVAQAVYAKVAPSVVLIIVEDRSGKPVSQGSGFVIEGNLIVTNAHVVRGGAAFVQTGVAKVPCTISRIDERFDLAVLRAAVPLTAPALRAAPANTLIGTRIFALGNPQGLERTITEGLYTGPRNFNGVTLLQISAPISPGSSGGPIVDSNGFVVGIAVSSLEAGQNLNFAVPVDTLLSLLAQPEMAPPPASTVPAPSVPAAASTRAPGGNTGAMSTAAALEQFRSLQEQRRAIRVTPETTEQWVAMIKRERDVLGVAMKAARNDDDLRDVHSAATNGHHDIAIEAAKLGLQRASAPKAWHHFGIAASAFAYAEPSDEPRKTELLKEARAAVLKGVQMQGASKGWMLAGQIHAALKEWGSAQAAFKLALTVGTAAEDRPTVLRGLWLSSAALSQPAEAERWFIDFTAAGGAGDDDLRVRADQLLDLNRFADAAAQYEALAGKAGQRTAATSTQLWYSAAYSRWLAGDNDAASKDAVRAIEGAGPESKRALSQSHALLANIFMLKGDDELASEAGRRAIAADPTYPWGHAQFARALNLLGRAAEAEAPARKAVELSQGKDSEAHFALASAYFLQRKWELALESYQHAARLEPTSGYAAYNVGLSLENLGRLKEALTWYEETLRRAPQLKEREQVLASIARVKGKG